MDDHSNFFAILFFSLGITQEESNIQRRSNISEIGAEIQDGWPKHSAFSPLLQSGLCFIAYLSPLRSENSWFPSSVTQRPRAGSI